MYLNDPERVPIYNVNSKIAELQKKLLFQEYPTFNLQEKRLY